MVSATRLTKAKGLTLLELIVTMAIVAIILTVALPNFMFMVRDYKTGAHTNDFISALAYARSEAVKTGNNVSLVAEDSSFINGWKIQSGGVDLKEHEALSGSELCTTATCTGGTAVTIFTFDRLGGSTGGMIGFQPTDCDGISSGVRLISVNRMGRVTTTRIACS